MARAGVEVSLGVVVRALVFVLDSEADGGAERHTELGARLDADGVRFVSLETQQQHKEEESGVSVACQSEAIVRNKERGEAAQMMQLSSSNIPTYWCGELALTGSTA